MSVIGRHICPRPLDLQDCLFTKRDRPTFLTALYEQWIEEIFDNSKPDYVGFSVAFGEQLSETIYLARLVRRCHPETKLILGGSQINLLSDYQIRTLIESKLFECISIGHGELVLSDIIETATHGQSGSSVIKSRAIKNTDLRNMPSASFEKLTDYWEPLMLPVLVTKGCYWGQCEFCDYVRLGEIDGGRFAARPSKEVFDEIQAMKQKHKPRQILLISDAVPVSWYKKLAQQAVENGVLLNTWSYMMHSANFSVEFAQLLENAGVRSITFGTESTNDRILKRMRKQATGEIIKNNLELLKKHTSIRVSCNFIVDYPTASFVEMLKVSNDVYDMMPLIDSINPQMFDFTDGTEVVRQSEKDGIQLNKTAYTKSSHGFHSFEVMKRTDMRRHERVIIQGIFARMAGERRIKGRAQAFKPPFWEGLDEEGHVIFDKEVVGLNEEWTKIRILALGIETALAPWEGKVVRDVIREGGVLRTQEAAEIIENQKDVCKYKGYEDWLASLAHRGLLLGGESLDMGIPAN